MSETLFETALQIARVLDGRSFNSLDRINMKLHSLVIIVSQSLSQHSTPISASFADSITISVVEAINRRELNLAEDLINTQLRQHPNSLKWYFYRGICSYADLMIHFSVNQEALKSMKANMERVQQLGEEVFRTRPDDHETLFYVGGAYGYLGLAEFADGSVFSAVGTAKKGFKLQEKLITLCPSCHDAYLGPGMMNFMASAVPWFLRQILWMFGLSGTEEKAYEYLTTAYEKGTLVRFEAGTYLAKVFERKKQFQEASELYKQFVHDYPRNVYLRIDYFSPLWHLKRYDEIIQSSNDIITIFATSAIPFGHSDSAWIPIIASNLGLAHKLQGDTVRAIQVLEDFVARSEFRAIDKWRVHSNLGEYYAARKDVSKALMHYGQVASGNAPSGTKKRARSYIEDHGTKQ